ncbi:MAG TPA: hypothetical protein VF246_00460 [Acidimicrobiia bacterium]
MRRASLLALIAFFLALPVAAQTCVTDQAMTPSQVLEAGLRSGAQEYDLAFVAVVESEDKAENQQSALVDLVGVYGEASAPATATVTFASPGIAGGSIEELQVGTAYFIPVVATGPDGQANYTTSCDPIVEVDDPEDFAVDLAVVAESQGIEFSLPVQTGGSGGAGLVTVVFLGVLGLLLYWTLRMRQSSRRRLRPTDSDPHPPREPRP